MELIDDVPIEIIDVAEEIVFNIKLEMGEKINDIIYINIIDHINSSIKRYHDGIIITNNLLPEIELFYQKEYKLSKEAVKTINSKFNVDLTDDEIGFIALHIVKAIISETKDLYSYKITQMMKDVLNIVRRYYKVEFDEKSLYYHRFITLLRFFGERMFLGNSNNSDSFNELLEIVKEKYKQEYSCALLIKEYIENNYKKYFTQEEFLYLTIHVQKIIEECTRKNKDE